MGEKGKLWTKIFLLNLQKLKVEKTGYDRYFTTFTIFREFETTEELDFPLSSSFDSLNFEGKKSMILKYATHIEGYNGNELHKIQPEVLENLLKANTQN